MEKRCKKVSLIGIVMFLWVAHLFAQGPDTLGVTVVATSTLGFRHTDVGAPAFVAGENNTVTGDKSAVGGDWWSDESWFDATDSEGDSVSANCGCSAVWPFMYPTHPACVPQGYYVVHEERNEDGFKPDYYVGYSTTTPMKHAALFRIDPPLTMTITHVCVNAKPPGGNNYAYVFFAEKDPTNDNYPDTLSPLRDATETKFLIDTTGAGVHYHQYFRLVELRKPYTMPSSKEFWVVVSYPTATGSIVHQGTRPRGTKSFSQYNVAAVYTEKKDYWEEYDSIVTHPGYAGKNPSIGLYAYASYDPQNLITIDPTSGLITSENGDSAQFTVSVNYPIYNDVTTDFVSTDTTEGIPIPNQAIFTPSNYDTSRTVFVHGQDDFILDGDIPYEIVSTVTSVDPYWDGTFVPNVNVTNLDNETGIEEEEFSQRGFFVSQSEPNPPQADRTLIKYGLPKSSNVHIVIYNLLGQEVRMLVDNKQNAGIYTVVWDGRDNAGEKLSSGVYFLRFEAGRYNATRKVLIMR